MVWLVMRFMPMTDTYRDALLLFPAEPVAPVTSELSMDAYREARVVSESPLTSDAQLDRAEERWEESRKGT